MFALNPACLLRALLCGLCMLATVALAAEDFGQWLAKGIAYRQQGQLTLSIDALLEAQRGAADDGERALAAGELGASLLQARRSLEAQVQLKQAYEHFSGRERARYAVDLGNLSVRRNRQQALAYFREARQLAGDDPVIIATAGLNEVRLLPPAERLSALADLRAVIARVPAGAVRARLALNLGHQARAAGRGGVPLAYEQTEAARQWAQTAGDSRLLAEALDALAQLYEEEGRDDDALRLTAEGLAVIRRAPAVSAGDLFIPLAWRQGRIAVRQGREEAALAAYRLAVDQIERIRQDIPIEYEDNRSSFRDTLEPIYLGLAERLLVAAEKTQGGARDAALRQVRAVVELIKQTEMQDYLGDRCSVLAHDANTSLVLPAGSAVLYPIILPDRLELLLETPGGMLRRQAPVKGERLRQVAQAYAARVRADPAAELPQARLLYDWLIAPVMADLAAAGTKTLVVVPDGVLRTVPMAALHDGQSYLIERLAVATAPGLTMTQFASGNQNRFETLVAGLAEPGPVVDKLTSLRLSAILQPVGGATSRSVVGLKTRALPADFSTRAAREVRDALRLPGVRDEVESLTRQMTSRSLLDNAFTLNQFSLSVGSGEFGIVHIASHGVFGGSGDESFILAYDDLLTMDRLQQLLRSERLRKNPIRLLTLSACETAEGNERAPLGIAGAALKANAETALGTLWPVEDSAASLIMQRFYQGLVKEGLSRAEALRRAQVDVMKTPEMRHPFFWAPFIIVGNWN